jgi:hypothetical protein
MNMELPTIALVTCFFGEWADWADFFIHSCDYNPTVDFFLITDCHPRQPLASNVKLVEFDLGRFKALATERLGVEVVLDKAYKLCDFKPTWGVLFEELLRGYDFWGYCDQDVIFGDIRAFLGEELLRQYDVICGRREFMTGHFSLYRNNDLCRRLYERSRDYREVFSSAQITAFDECGRGLHAKLFHGASFAEIAAEGKIDSMMHIISRTPEVRLLLKPLCDEWMRPQYDLGVKSRRFRWENGKLFEEVAGKEVMYVHMWYLKHQRRLFVPRWPQLPPAFRLTERGFFWVGSQPLGQRLATESHRALYLFGRFFWAVYNNVTIGIYQAWRERRHAHIAA